LVFSHLSPSAVSMPFPPVRSVRFGALCGFARKRAPPTIDALEDLTRKLRPRREHLPGDLKAAAKLEARRERPLLQIAGRPGVVGRRLCDHAFKERRHEETGIARSIAAGTGERLLVGKGLRGAGECVLAGLRIEGDGSIERPSS